MERLRMARNVLLLGVLLCGQSIVGRVMGGRFNLGELIATGIVGVSINIRAILGWNTSASEHLS
jgi:hypothetical protein